MLRIIPHSWKYSIIANLLLVFLITPAVGYGKSVVKINIKPEDVGVFYKNKTQQFQAIAVFSDGSQADYTKKVGWSIAKNPFPNQTLAPTKVATINENGLATVVSTWGRVNVVATYPKPKPKPPPALAGIYDILLKGGPGKGRNAHLPIIYYLLLHD